MSLRKTTSLTTLLSFILLLITSVILYVTPQGKIAFWANWKMLGLGKEEWGALHTNLGFLFIAAGLIHTILNWGPIVAYMKNKAKKLNVFTPDFNVALAITLVITFFTLLELPPIHAIQTLNESLKDAAAEEYGEPPYGHAEASSLKSFCKRTGIDLKSALKKLKKAELNAVAEKATLAEIATANFMTPQQVFELIKPPAAEDGEEAMPKKPGMGFGRKQLADVCKSYGVDLRQTIDGLRQQGLEVSDGLSIKEIAEKNDTEPYVVFDAIRQIHAE